RGLLIGKQVDFSVIGIHLVNGFEDQVRPLGLLFPERDPNNKKVPTMKEEGVAYTQVFTPMLVMAPKKTPDSAIKAFDAACAKMTAHKAYGRLLKKAGLPTKYLDGPKAEKYYRDLTVEWQPLVDELKSAKKNKKKK
ncbi:MAG: hypothetical protein MJE12_07880, partial [Alphaproteobacteria bacterium]|nr:hypothetical protein [Alphaproteobacteria bacterium]